MRALCMLTAPILLLSAVGCGGKEKPAETPVSETTLTSQPEVKAVTPSIGVSEDILTKCKLSLGDAAKAPKFAFDESDLPPERGVLEQIAQCLTAGPLAGRSVRLVGRADPRGTVDYNLALGARRANSVATYLQHLGVDRGKMQETSRGELDATGTDEASWLTDRRVDVVLVE